MGRTLREEDYVGKTFNHLTVIRKTNQKRNGTYLWEFLCDCGNTYYNIMSYVKNGNSKSCGYQKSKGLVDWNKNNRTIKNRRCIWQINCFRRSWTISLFRWTLENEIHMFV